MPLVPWTSLVLCTAADIEAEASRIASRVNTNTAARETSVAQAIATAKTVLRQWLLRDLPDMFRASAQSTGYGGNMSAWLVTAGYSYTDLDVMLDRIRNPDELRPVMVTLAMRALVFNELTGTDVSNVEGADTRLNLHALLNKMVNERYATAVKLLAFDLNNSGTVEDSERTRARTQTIWRG